VLRYLRILYFISPDAVFHNNVKKDGESEVRWW